MSKHRKSKYLRRLIAAGEPLGFIYIGIDGTGHFVFKKDDVKVPVSGTPRCEEVAFRKTLSIQEYAGQENRNGVPLAFA